MEICQREITDVDEVWLFSVLNTKIAVFKKALS